MAKNEQDAGALQVLENLEETQPFYMRWYNWLTGAQMQFITRSMFSLVTMMSAVTVVAMFMYGALYYVYIPQTMLSKQIHFQRNEIIKNKADAYGDMTRTAVSLLHGEVSLNEHDPFIASGQGYNVELKLNMPDSEVNHIAGTFMVTSLYYDNKKSLLTSSSRLVMLKYKSWLLRTMDTLFYAPLYLLAISDQRQIRHVQLFQNYRENSYRHTSVIAIDIDNVNLQIYDAHITVEAQFSGLKYYMYNWPLSTAIIVTIFIWHVLFLITSSSWYALSARSKQSKDQNYQAVLKYATHTPTATKASLIEQSQSEDELAPNKPDTSLQSAERTTIHVGNRTEVTSLGVTPLDSSDMTKREATIRRQNHTAEQSST